MMIELTLTREKVARIINVLSETGEDHELCMELSGQLNPEFEPDDSMDGDAASALASAGFGTDEDYEHNLYDE